MVNGSGVHQPVLRCAHVPANSRIRFGIGICYDIECAPLARRFRWISFRLQQHSINLGLRVTVVRPVSFLFTLEALLLAVVTSSTLASLSLLPFVVARLAISGLKHGETSHCFLLTFILIKDVFEYIIKIDACWLKGG